MRRRSQKAMDNVSAVSVMTLLAVNVTVSQRVTIFTLTLLCYLTIWLTNVTIIVTIVVDKNLHEPMYVFLCNLCVNGLYGTAGFYPKFLADLWSSTYVISHAGCLLQGFVVHSSGCADLSFLMLMAYDRYVAICQPLIYTSVMTKERVGIFVFFAWLVPLYLVLVGTITTAILRLCGSHIAKIYCMNFLIGKLACTASVATTAVPAFNYTVYVIHFLFILFSYGSLVKNCLLSSENRSKFMQTCLPHVVCLFLFLVSTGFDLMYVRFGKASVSQSLKNFMAIEFLIVPPILNPVIYGLKLTKIRRRLAGFFGCAR